MSRIVPELNDYEEGRAPHETEADLVARLNLKDLDSELICPICLSIMQQTMTTMECMHRFCNDCIIRSISAKKQCPTCREYLPSKRSLRPDPQMDAIIALTYPNREEYEARQAEFLNKIRKYHNKNALAVSVQEGMEMQARSRSRRARGGRKGSVESERASKRQNTRRAAGHGKMRRTVHTAPDSVELKLVPHPDDPGVAALTHSFLTVPRHCTFQHLAKFLFLQLEEAGSDHNELDEDMQLDRELCTYSLAVGDVVPSPRDSVSDLDAAKHGRVYYYRRRD